MLSRSCSTSILPMFFCCMACCSRFGPNCPGLCKPFVRRCGIAWRCLRLWQMLDIWLTPACECHITPLVTGVHFPLGACESVMTQERYGAGGQLFQLNHSRIVATHCPIPVPKLPGPDAQQTHGMLQRRDFHCNSYAIILLVLKLTHPCCAGQHTPGRPKPCFEPFRCEYPPSFSYWRIAEQLALCYATHAAG